MNLHKRYIAAAAQLGPVEPSESKEAVVVRMRNLLIEAKKQGALLIVYPELCLTTFFPRYYITDNTILDSFYEDKVPISLLSEMLGLVNSDDIIYLVWIC
jgi:N-carbamoyl-D-amino-acid hydrolase